VPNLSAGDLLDMNIESRIQNIKQRHAVFEVDDAEAYRRPIIRGLSVSGSG
jgi:hypothetical protein